MSMFTQLHLIGAGLGAVIILTGVILIMDITTIIHTIIMDITVQLIIHTITMLQLGIQAMIGGMDILIMSVIMVIATIAHIIEHTIQVVVQFLQEAVDLHSVADALLSEAADLHYALLTQTVHL